MVAAFAALTGDRNPLHLDPQIARRFRYRKPVVHGMLPVSLLSCLEEVFPQGAVNFCSITVRFLAPVFVGVDIRLQIEAPAAPPGELAFKASWKRAEDGERLLEASGTVRLASPAPDSRAGTDPTRSDQRPAMSGQPAIPPPAGSHTSGEQFDASWCCLVTERISEQALRIEELEGRSDRLQFLLDRRVLDRFQAALFLPALGRADYRFCPNLAAALLLSPLVGMRLPGRYATFNGFRVLFHEAVALDVPASLLGSVTSVSSATESASIAVSFEQRGQEVGSGQLGVLVNPPPRTMIDCHTIKQRYLETGVRGKVAVITGASRGIGETTAKLFAMHGARTVVHYYQGRKDADDIVHEIGAAGGIATALGCDIRDEQDVARFFAEILEAYGRVDILVNNAVGDFRPAPYLKLRWEDYLQELDVSLKGMHNCCREAVAIFKRQGAGKIVNLSSVAVDNPVTGQNKYITAKSAVVGYTRSLARELAAHNIQANLVVPALTETDLVSSIPGEFIRRMAAERDAGRHLAPIEVALCILYLSSNWTDGISGQQVVLNLAEPPFA
jgi:3-oxoacyl-[acyl-carrier protein] reductase